MKKITYTLLLIFCFSNSFAQKSGAISLSADYINIYKYGINGAGYTLAWQKNLSSKIVLETGISYAQAFGLDVRNEQVGNIELLTLSRQHLEYSAHLTPGFSFPASEKLQFQILCGPIISYRSTVLDITHYRIMSEEEYTSDPSDIIYKNEVIEGGRIAGMLSFRAGLQISNNWKLLLGANVKQYIHSPFTFNGCLGVANTF